MNPIDIRVISDFVCPWCPIGEKQLEAAVQAVGSDIVVRVTYEPFELNPDMPKEGLNRREYRSRKFGSWARSQAMDAQVTDAGQRVGVTFNYDIIERTPNTRLAHRLMWFAQSKGKGDATALYRAIFSSYFEKGRDTGNAYVLTDIAGSVGLNRAEVEQFLATTEGEQEVLRAELQLTSNGIQSVPTVEIAGQLVSGGQPAAVFEAVIRRAAAKSTEPQAA
jgi:predicted DsbA family dithiol-disulfide isomerase